MEIAHCPSSLLALIVSINSQDGWEDKWSSGEIAKKWLTWFQEGGRKYTQEKRPQFKPRGQWSQGIGDHWLLSSKLDHILSFSGQAWGGVLNGKPISILHAIARIQEDSNQHGIFLAEQQQGCPSNVLQEEVLKRLTRRLQSPPQSLRLKKIMQWLFVKRNGVRDSSVQARRKTHLTNIPHICKGST